MCFRSAVISLFERPSAGVEQNAAISIRWSELQQNRHHCCYTITYSAHAAHWVRSGKNDIVTSVCTFLSVTKQNSASLLLDNVNIQGIKFIQFQDTTRDKQCPE